MRRKAQAQNKCMTFAVIFVVVQTNMAFGSIWPNKSLCGHQFHLQSRIINGDNASPGEWPWQAGITKHNSINSWFQCGGVLIHPQWVLTAAHCVNSNITSQYTLTLGDLDRTKSENTEQVFGVKRIVKHKDFNVLSPYDSDVALLHLSRPAMLNGWVNTVCLPTKEASPGTQCFMSGWGYNSSAVKKVASHLQKAAMPIVSNTECATRLQGQPIRGLVQVDSRPWKVTSTMICAGNSQQGKISGCYGDSGGPLQCKNTAGQWEVQGLVGWGDQTCNAKNFFTVFTRVHKFYPWIKENILKYSPIPAFFHTL